VSMTIIVLAAIAAFLGLRLYSVLGKRTGHEQQPLPPQPDRTLEPRGPVLGAPVAVEPSPQAATTANRGIDLAFEPRAGSGLQTIALSDAGFDPVRFLEGAKSAYPMILQAYWSGDRETLRNLCDSDVAEAFEAAITAREANGETLDNKFVSFDTATITDAQLDGAIARIVVRFDAYIIAVTRNSEGAIIAGSMSDAVEAHDIWTFSRNISSNNPNWTLDETDAA
jgi:predicted lipid-binding transport protein (Tim44 family)